MMDFITQNFNWPTFIIALGVFAFFNSLINYLVAVVRKNQADRKLKASDREYQALKSKLGAIDKEYDRVMGDKGAK